MSYSYYKKKYFNSDVYVFEFNPQEIRWDVTVGKRWKLEKLSTIEAEMKEGEVPIAKINGGFFAMNGKAEYIGTFVDDGLYYNPSAPMYPTAVFDKNYKLKVVNNPTQDQLAVFQKEAFWAIGCPWTLIIDGKVNYQYSKQELISMFGHPWQKAPRTMMGQRKDGTVIWAVVDGRRWNSPGVTIDQQSSIMLDLCCDIAFNLDGGGSSEMIYDGEIVNKVSDKIERYIGTAFVALKPPVKNISTKVGVVNSRTGLILREEATTKSARLNALPNGSSVIVLENGEKYNGFYKVQVGSVVGYMSASFLKLL